MRRALGLTTGLALVAVALSPIAPAQAATCVSAVEKCEREPLVKIKLKAKGTPRVHQGGRVTYTLDYSMTWMESFAPYWASFWVGGTLPRGAKAPRTATLMDPSGRKVATFPCHRYRDGLWCEVPSDVSKPVPHKGRIVLSTTLARHGGRTAVARLGFDSVDGLGQKDFERHYGRAAARDRFCVFRFTKTVVTKVRS
ncbi:hypothetical protein [Streptosporangium sp. NPDC020145]|uniref:hypothetical protein n=1 Tax=Streptosporangium sp. NPDC020145 TaxID=3154694 RepID=UPI003447F389